MEFLKLGASKKKGRISIVERLSIDLFFFSQPRLANSTFHAQSAECNLPDISSGSCCGIFLGRNHIDPCGVLLATTPSSPRRLAKALGDSKLEAHGAAR